MATTWDPIDMEKVAFHEAGHAVVAWLFGLRLKRIYLDLETEGGGAPAVAPAGLGLVQRIVILYAGTVSEEIFKGPAVFRRSIEDRANVHVLLEKNGTPEEDSRRAGSHSQGLFVGRKIIAQARGQGLGGLPSACCSQRTINPARFKQLMREAE